MTQTNGRLSRLRNRHTGRVVLVCNGPSLNQMRLRFLRKEIVIGVNKIYLGFRQFGFYPRYFVAVNKKVLEQSAQEIRRLNCVKFLSKRAEDILPENALTYHIETRGPVEKFCRDITKGVHEGWTVTYAALQIAYYLGFNEVVIIGMDHRFEYQGRPNESSVLQGEDPNHFCADYFGGGQSWDNPDLERSEESYRLARSVYEQDRRRIVDATVDGACEVFEKRDYRELFDC